MADTPTPTPDVFDGDVLDLDRARAARREGRGAGLTVRLSGETFTLPVEMPLEVAFAEAEGDAARMLGALFGDDLDRVLDLGLTIEDLRDLARYGYGVAPGEALASPTGSGPGGTPSRQTSKSTTGSTSAGKGSDA